MLYGQDRAAKVPQKRLLVITQVMDETHPILGFFINWVRGWKTSFAALRVITLQKQLALAIEGVPIYSLGKEDGASRWSRVLRLWREVWHARNEYDAVFVHMNEEYILLCGIFWRLYRKRVYLWRNHPVGTWKTPIAAWLAHEVFYTSPQAYVAKYDHSVQMPAGIPIPEMHSCAQKIKGYIVMAGRIAEWCKRTHLLVEAGIRLSKEPRVTEWYIQIIGDPDKGQEGYYKELQARVQEEGLEERIQFLPGRPYADVLKVYASADVVVNTTQSGSFDKALLEGMAFGCIPLTSNKALADVLPSICILEEDSAESLLSGLRAILTMGESEKHSLREIAYNYVAKQQSFTALTKRLVERIDEGSKK